MNMQTILSFEESLKVGDAVVIRWTNSGCYHAVPGKVWKVNAKSFLVQIDETIMDRYTGKPAYGKGHVIKAPRYSFSPGCTWSRNNRVEAVEVVNV